MRCNMYIQYVCATSYHTVFCRVRAWGVLLQGVGVGVGGVSHLYWLGTSRVFESERGDSSPTASTCMEPGVGGEWVGGKGRVRGHEE